MRAAKGERAANASDDAANRGAMLKDCAILDLGCRCKVEALGRLHDGSGREPESLALQSHHALTPATRGGVKDELPHGQAVEELVSDDNSRAVWDVFQIFRPENRNRRVSKGGSLLFLQRLRGLDEVDRRASQKAGQHLESAESVGHQRSTPGPKLDQPDRRGLSHLAPNLARP